MLLSSPLTAFNFQKRNKSSVHIHIQRICLFGLFAAFLLIECPQIGSASQQEMQMDLEKNVQMNESGPYQQRISIPASAPLVAGEGGANVRASRVKRQHVHDNTGFSVKNLIELILCFFLPPAAVALHGGASFKLHILLNVVLCVLGWIPGILHAIWYCFLSGF